MSYALGNASKARPLFQHARNYVFANWFATYVCLDGAGQPSPPLRACALRVLRYR